MAAEVGSLMRLLAGYDKAKGRTLDPEDREKLPDFMRRSGGRLHDLNLPPPVPPAPAHGPAHAPAPAPAHGPAHAHAPAPALGPAHAHAPAPAHGPAHAHAPALLNMLDGPAAPAYQSVCTLERVKSALERLHRPELSRGSTSPASSSTTTSSAKRRPSDDADGDSTSSPPAAEMVAAGCPSCLLYVLISSSKPRCPRCDSAVPLPLPGARKKQKIDLNAASTSVPLRTVKFF